MLTAPVRGTCEWPNDVDDCDRKAMIELQGKRLCAKHWKEARGPSRSRSRSRS